MFTYRNRLLKKVKGLRSKRDGITEQDKAKVIYLTKFEGMEQIKIVLDNYIVHYNQKNQSTVKKNESSIIPDSHSNSRLIFCLILQVQFIIGDRLLACYAQ
ncbi:hypothetical protein DN396_28770 [Bacillus sp. BF9-10]|nr:hypothetical protein DN396_28770 [Bacillus sp. BF9-10]